MLKRKGHLPQHEVPGYGGRLNDAELASYKDAFATIERDYQEIENVKSQLSRLEKGGWEKADAKNIGAVTTPDGTEWKAEASLLTLPKSDVLLCQKREGEWGIVQRLNANGSYAANHGNAAVLLTGNNPDELVKEYGGQAEHTLRFMARNLTVKAQEVVWGKHGDHNPAQVMRAISRRCALAVDDPEALRREQAKRQNQRQSRGMSI